MPWPLYPLGKEPLVPTEQEARWAPELVWMLWSREKLSYPCQHSNQSGGGGGSSSSSRKFLLIIQMYIQILLHFMICDMIIQDLKCSINVKLNYSLIKGITE
jgi:hypothetical protein